MNNLLIFNPEHDLAMGNGDRHYVPPTTAVQFANEAAILPAWIYRQGMICSDTPIESSFLQLLSLFNIDIQLIKKQHLSEQKFNAIIPWGWDLRLKEQLLQTNISESQLPDDKAIEKIKALSHRKTAIEAQNIIQQKWPFQNAIFPLPQCATSLNEVEKLTQKFGKIIMKMPWSGSGKGLRLADTQLTPHEKGWANNVIQRQGSVIIESYHTVIQDFAMEFYCNKEVQFIGFSLFSNSNGAYSGNWLASDEKIKEKLTQYIDKEQLEFCKEELIHFIYEKIAPTYTGYIGVDMYIYQEENQYKLRPVCEMNIRTTMGVLARKLHNQFLHSETTATLSTHFSTLPQKLLNEYSEICQNNPLRIANQRIISGILPLIPITANSHYAIWVNVEHPH
ncbi:MAG: hypothetical protein MJZ76_06210 [Bacteroidales bacterium]|nr:hypothetical protein [Bacteroidales bacterium]